ncbi:MAG: hypothetical protein HN790_00150 [Methylococcales bacterium]|nr:hypothetical protein [Methylococcales bacterium]
MMEQAQQETQELMNAVLPMAEKMLTGQGYFYPYGGAMTPAGDIIDIVSHIETDKPSASDMIAVLQDKLVGSAVNKDFKATALVYDSMIAASNNSEKSDAIAINLDHELGYSVVVFVPYTVEEGKVSLGELTIQAGDKSVFAQV